MYYYRSAEPDRRLWGLTGRVELSDHAYPAVWLDNVAIGHLDPPQRPLGWVPWLRDDRHGVHRTRVGSSFPSLDHAVLWLLDNTAPDVASTERLAREPVLFILDRPVPDPIAAWRRRQYDVGALCAEAAPVSDDRSGQRWCERPAGHTGRHSAKTGGRIAFVWEAATR